jgi:F-type H+-transporting ATPase subunit delta
MAQTTADSPARIIDEIARTYAQSLLDLAEEQGVTDEVADELGQLVELLDQEAVSQLLTSPAITVDDRAASLERVFKGQVSDLTYRFLQVLNEKRRIDHLRAIAWALEALLKKKRGEVDVLVYAAQPLSDEQLRDVRQRLASSLQATVHLATRVDESMIGGLKLRIGDKLIDGSVATQLQKLKRRLIASGRESIRTEGTRLLEESSDER